MQSNENCQLSQSVKKSFTVQNKEFSYFSLPDLASKLGVNLRKLPVCVRVVLESVLRNSDGQRITDEDVRKLASWNAKAPAKDEVPFVVARIVLQDFTGVPLLVDIAAMRSAVARLGKDPNMIEPLVPVDLVIDHSVQVDYSGSNDALEKNIQKEFHRNRERYEFLKWGQQAFNTFKVVPPGIGIVHQVNLEYLAQGVLENKGVVYPDTLVGTDSHTTMINGLGVVGWGVGGIEAEAGMLGQPIYILTPEVVGVRLTGALQEGVTATDLTLTLTEMLRKENVVGKFVEYFGPGATALTLPDRATISNMAPEYGATMGFFPIDEETISYLKGTGRDSLRVEMTEQYFKAQELFGIPQNTDEVEYTKVLELDISTIKPSVAGPKRPQDRIVMNELGARFKSLMSTSKNDGGFGKNEGDLEKSFPIENPTNESLAGVSVRDGDVLIAAITSCTNTSNPSVMIAAGLLAKKAVEKGLALGPLVKSSLAPGSRVVTDYLEQAGLQTYMDQLGFNLVGYGCTTCIGNSGPLDESIEKTVCDNNIVAASVLSGNRNFEARVHPNIKSNFLMSPPLVVAFALAGNVNIDLQKEALGQDKEGNKVFLKDLWPSMSEIKALMQKTLKAEVFQKLYRDFEKQNPAWNDISSSSGELYTWKTESTYIQEPPFFDNFSMEVPAVKPIENAKALLLLGDSVTTDHISPAGRFSSDSPAGVYLNDHGVKVEDFNSFGSRRGNDQVMTRGTFANVRIKNKMFDGLEGGYTKDFTQGGVQSSVYDAAQNYRKQGTSLVVIAGKEYGTGSSRDWAAKGTLLLGVKAVIAESYERIHRSNLVGMGVLPLSFEKGTSAQSLGLDGSETFTVHGLSEQLVARQKLELEIVSEKGTQKVPVDLKIDTPVEIEYYKHGGILPYVLRQIIDSQS